MKHQAVKKAGIGKAEQSGWGGGDDRD